VLQIGGEIDIATAEQLRFALKRALADDPTVVVDMSEVEFIDLTGLRVFLEAAETRNGDGPLQLINAARVEWLLEVVGIDAQGASLHIRGGA
jgi:anti-anti-sigma factor